MDGRTDFFFSLSRPKKKCVKLQQSNGPNAVCKSDNVLLLPMARGPLRPVKGQEIRESCEKLEEWNCYTSNCGI